MQKECNLPPEGWKCTREEGHEGPCAAVHVPNVEIPEKELNKLKRKHYGKGYPNRLLAALADIYEDPISKTSDKLQAIRLSLDTMPHRRLPHRKTDKDKAVLEALGKPSTNKQRSMNEMQKEAMLKKPTLEPPPETGKSE